MLYAIVHWALPGPPNSILVASIPFMVSEKGSTGQLWRFVRLVNDDDRQDDTHDQTLHHLRALVLQNDRPAMPMNLKCLLSGCISNRSKKVLI